MSNTRIWLAPQICSLATPMLENFNQQCPNSQWFNNRSTKSPTLQWNTFIKIIYPGNRFFTNERKGLFYSQSVGWIFTIHLQIPFKDLTVYGLNFNHFNHWQSASSEYLSTADSHTVITERSYDTERSELYTDGDLYQIKRTVMVWPTWHNM